MSGPHQKIVTIDQLIAARERLRAEGKTVVQCHGCFDLVHPGHIRYLQFAKQLGDALIVSVSGDDVVGKGPDRPYIVEGLRLENLAVLEFVDYVCLDDSDWAGPILERVRPDVYVKGKEYENKGDPRFARERELVEGYGGKVVFSSGEVIYSSTFILNRFKERFPLERERVEYYCRQHDVTRARLKGVLRQIAGARVLVFGDPILDQYVHCDATGIASETPILSVCPIREEWFLGAGGLIAAQLVELGAQAGLLTGLSDGPFADRFREAAAGRHIPVYEVATDRRPVAIKTRYLVDEQKVFKVDSHRVLPLSTQATSDLIAALGDRLAAYDALVVTDFGYGLFNQPIIDAVARVCAELGKPYYLDVSHTRRASIRRFRGARLATPTEQELRFAFADDEAGLSHLAALFFEETHTEQLMLTMGKRGVLLFARPARPRQRLKTDFLPALDSAPVDPIGAGDVFLSAAMLSDLGGAGPHVGAYFGAALAALHVSRLGNSPVEASMLHGYLEQCRELGP